MEHHRRPDRQPARCLLQRPDRRGATLAGERRGGDQADVQVRSGTTLDDIVRAVNQVGAAPSDLMAILEALKQAGALQADLIVI